MRCCGLTYLHNKCHENLDLRRSSTSRERRQQRVAQAAHGHAPHGLLDATHITQDHNPRTSRNAHGNWARSRLPTPAAQLHVSLAKPAVLKSPSPPLPSPPRLPPLPRSQPLSNARAPHPCPCQDSALVPCPSHLSRPFRPPRGSLSEMSPVAGRTWRACRSLRGRRWQWSCVPLGDCATLPKRGVLEIYDRARNQRRKACERRHKEHMWYARRENPREGRDRARRKRDLEHARNRMRKKGDA